MVSNSAPGFPGVGFGLYYVAFEKLRTTTDLSFPADLLAHGFGTNPSFLAWTPYYGPFGVSLSVMLVGLLLDAAIEARPGRAAVTGWPQRRWRSGSRHPRSTPSPGAV